MPNLCEGEESKVKGKKINVGETLMAIHLRELGLGFDTQARVFPDRKWKWDFLVADNILIEIDGYFAGHHGAGYGSDNEKANTATMMGFRCLRFSTNDVKRGKAKEFLKQWLT